MLIRTLESGNKRISCRRRIWSLPDLVSRDCKNKRGECFVLLEELGILCCVGNLVPYEPAHGYEQPPQKGETFSRRIDILAINK